jgi:hypothetical protein
MTNNFVFRAVPDSSVESDEELFERVFALGAELLLEGRVSDFRPMVGSRWNDKSGPAVLVPIFGPPGWQFHQGHVLKRHGLTCVPYP